MKLKNLILKAKDRFSQNYEQPVGILSIVNMIVGIVAWFAVVLLMRMP